jgi:hypothetical protein
MESTRLSLPDVAERVARSMGPFRDAVEQEAAAKSCEQDGTGPAELLLYHARARLTAEAKQAAATLRKTYGLGKRA